jgi:hypothetical protein
MCANKVGAGVRLSTLPPNIRPQDTRQFGSGKQINQLEGLALARPWGIESPILTEVLSQIVNGRMLRPGLPVENQADRRGEDILDKGIHQKPHAV